MNQLTHGVGNEVDAISRINCKSENPLTHITHTGKPTAAVSKLILLPLMAQLWENLWNRGGSGLYHQVNNLTTGKLLKAVTLLLCL